MAITLADVLWYFDHQRGEMPTIGGPPVHTRAGNAYERGANGLYVPRGVDTPRFEPEGLLLELSRTNALVDPNNLTTANWGTSGTVTRTQNALGIDGALNGATTVEDTDGTNQSYIFQDEVIADDAALHAAMILIAKDNDQSRFPAFELVLQGGTAVINRVQLNSESGAISVIQQNTGSSHHLLDRGAFWELQLISTNNTTGNTVARSRVFPAHGTTFGTGSTEATGKCAVGWMQFELGATFVTSPVDGARAADSCYWENPPPPQAMAIYSSWIANAPPVANGRVWEKGIDDNRLLIYSGVSTINFTLRSNAESINVGGQTFARGDKLEAVGIVRTDGTTRFIVSINGAAVSGAAGAAPAAGLPAAWDQNTWHLNESGSGTRKYATQHQYHKAVKLAALTAATDGTADQAVMDEMRGLYVSPDRLRVSNAIAA